MNDMVQLSCTQLVAVAQRGDRKRGGQSCEMGLEAAADVRVMAVR